MENAKDPKIEDNSTSFMPSKPLNDSDDNANESVADVNENESVADANDNESVADAITVNDVNSSSPSQENIASTPEESMMPSSSMSSPSMQYSEQSDNMPNVSLPGSSGQQETLTSTGDLVSGEYYCYLGNVQNIDGQLAPIFRVADRPISRGGRSRKRRRRRRKGGATEKKMMDGGRRQSKRVNKSQYRKSRSYRGGVPSAMSPLMAYNVPV